MDPGDLWTSEVLVKLNDHWEKSITSMYTRESQTLAFAVLLSSWPKCIFLTSVFSVFETNINVHWTSWGSKHWPCSNIFHVHDFQPLFFPRWPLSPVAVALLWPWLLVANSLCLKQVEWWPEGSKITKSYNLQMPKNHQAIILLFPEMELFCS